MVYILLLLWHTHFMSSYKKSGFSRALSLTKTSLNLGKLAFQQLKDDKRPPTEILLQQVQVMAKEMGALKGSLMKAGQMLSAYGEHFLPKEATEILKTLQQKAEPVPWKELEPYIKAELKEKYSDLKIEQEAFASASIGQVHRAWRIDTGEAIALKIQYPNLEKAIDMDLKFLKLILNSLKFVPQIPNYEEVYQEIKDMMLQEMDYRKELHFANEFRKKLSDDSRFLIPKAHEEFCTGRILAYEFIEGERFDSTKTQSMPQEFRDRVGTAFFDLYLTELFQFQMMQTDPHGGNYRLQIFEKTDSSVDFKIVLFDFGAVRLIPDWFLKNYLKITRGSLLNDSPQVLDGGLGLGILDSKDSEELKKDYIELCQMFIEPFIHSEKKYNFAESDLPKRVIQNTRNLVLKHGLRAPPREVVFLDRKLAGVYTTLKELRAEIQLRPILEKKISN